MTLCLSSRQLVYDRNITSSAFLRTCLMSQQHRNQKILKSHATMIVTSSRQ